MSNSARNLDKIKNEARERRRNILHLIHKYLKDNFLEDTAENLAREAQLDNKHQVCENVELDIIFQEYLSYYHAKFQKYPKIVRKLEEVEIKRTSRARSAARKAAPKPTPQPSEEFQFEIVSLGDTKSPSKPAVMDFEAYSSESRDLVQQICSQVVSEVSVTWSDCVGLDSAVEVLKEATIYPLLYPEVFQNMYVWRGVLLHGPPGTGKTLLARALAGEGRTTFFNVTSSTFISKWRGESEKLIKHLFDMAKSSAPSTIFFDEIDCLVSNSQEIQHEASHRFKSELLIQLDGVATMSDRIFVLASTNSPWNLDEALLRRFDKRILIDMPDGEARQQILRQHHKLSPDNMVEFAKLTEHYSGSDIRNVAKEVSMGIVREKIRLLKGDGKTPVNRLVTFEDVKLALTKVKPSTSGVMLKKYHQWQNRHGAV